MDHSGTAPGGTDRSRGPGRYARPALIAGGVTAVVCVALLVIIFLPGLGGR